MNTPIAEFVRTYAASGVSRLHMPGHKGKGPLGCEQVDITEIAGADDLACPEGIIAESEANATALFGSRATLYSTGGSSQCVKAMLLLCARRSKNSVILAARNAHKSFIHACALLDLRPEWLCDEAGASSLCSCPVTPFTLRHALDSMVERPCAVYITSPDYLGSMQDVSSLASAAHEYGVPLIVDNAHGAYLRFLPDDEHPLSLGADMCCDSAHKTLGALTGGAYLHISAASAWSFERDAREALAVFGSSSPSYLTMQSLDLLNARLAGDYRTELSACVDRLDELKAALRGQGVPVMDSDPLRLTIAAHRAGMTGFELAESLRSQRAEPEFADRDYLVMMFTPDSDMVSYERVTSALEGFVPGEYRAPLALPTPSRRVLTPREALLALRETIPVFEAVGRVVASATVSCPPAIPVAVLGEELTAEHIAVMTALGIEQVDVVK